MSDDVRFERLVADVLSDMAPMRAPDQLIPQVLHAARRIRRWPRWLALAIERPMRRQAEVLVGSPTLRLAYLLGLSILLIGLALGALVVGGIAPVAEDLAGRNGEIAVRADIGNGNGAIIQVDPVTGEETILPVLVPPEDLWFEGLLRRSNTDLWWSPDGTRLAYIWSGDPYQGLGEAGDLWVLDVATGESREIVASCGCALAWSPDGFSIAITSGRNLEVLKSDGRDRTALDVPDGDGWIHDPAWTPDGKRIVFAEESNAPMHRLQRLYMIDRDGSNLTRLHEYEFDSRDVGNPVAWSPDGLRFATFAWAPAWTISVAIADIDGSNRRVALEDAGECCDSRVFWYPYLGWSPDGTQLALAIDGLGEKPQGLYVLNADGTNLRLIRADVMGRPAWRPAR